MRPLRCFICTPSHSCMEQIELSNGGNPFTHRSSDGGVKHRFRQGDVHQCSLHLLDIRCHLHFDTPTHTHPHTCTHAHSHTKGYPSHLFKDPSWAFALIPFVCFLPPSPVIFFSTSVLSPTVETIISNSSSLLLCSESKRRY